MIQQILLERTSEYFVKSLNHAHLGNGEADTLRFPEDEPEVWEMLLYWIFERKLLTDDANEFAMLLFKCWVLGDKYDIKQFQDNAMFALLRSLDSNSMAMLFETDEITSAIEQTAPGSVMRTLFMEEMVMMIWYHEEWAYDDLKDYASLNCLGDILRARDLYQQDERAVIYRFTVPRDGSQAPWTKFMVGDGAKRLAGYAKEYFDEKDSLD